MYNSWAEKKLIDDSVYFDNGFTVGTIITRRNQFYKIIQKHDDSCVCVYIYIYIIFYCDLINIFHGYGFKVRINKINKKFPQ